MKNKAEALQKEECPLAAKKMALEYGRSREADAFVPKQYSDQPRKMAEWEKDHGEV